MNSYDADRVFAGSIPSLYEKYLVPLIFAPYVGELISRLKTRRAASVLEIAAGTGVVTRALATELPESTNIVATDLNQAMLDQAATIGTKRPVEWRQADAMQLPFQESVFDAVVCQFGVMFFPEKSKAFSEVLRVLRPGGLFLFNVWDRIEENKFAQTILTALAAVFPNDPPRFMARTPHGYHDVCAIARDLKSGGFTSSPRIETVAARSRAPSSREPAIAYCEGTIWRNEIDARGPGRLAEITEIAADAIAKRFGRGPVDGKIQAHIITVAANG